jgi:Icc-related predicted phosphoesterase
MSSTQSEPVRIPSRDPQNREKPEQSNARNATVSVPADDAQTAQTTPRETPRASSNRLRIGAVGDLHYNVGSGGSLQSYFSEIRKHADVLLLCGDLTDHGLPEETKLLAQDLASVRIPIIAVLGNHDFESNRQDEVTSILRNANVEVLDGEATMVRDVGFAGIKGFAGGFDKAMLQPWGETGIKDFVRGAVDEALKLDSALAKIRTPHRVVLMHYAPIRMTVENEPLEIFPFLGSSRLEEPCNRYHASMVVHGHAHRGTMEGRTSAGVPVFNVALPLLRRTMADAFPLKVFELDVEEVATVR